MRFIVTFGLVVLLVVGGMAALARVLTRLFGGGTEATILTWIGGLGLALALRAFQGVATPLADVMAAADAVVDGDLSVRVPLPERGPDEFSNLARSSNRMAEEFERADRQRRSLTADVAHELRKPLHIIHGNLEGVPDGIYEPSDSHIVAMLEETRLPARLVEDLRTLSLAEMGELPLERETVDVVDLLADVRTSFTGQAEVAELEIRIKATQGLPLIVGDAGQLEQVLTNLVANAVRHTPCGGRITLGAHAIEDGVRITVEDTSEGIPAEDLPYVFDRFWRGDRSRSRANGTGSGLGLAIAQQLVEAHGGLIAVRSKLDEGTTFVVDLPGCSRNND